MTTRDLARRFGCEDLARIARMMLRIRRSASDLLDLPYAGQGFELAEALIANLPLGLNESTVACCPNGAPLRNCACYRDVRKEGEAMIRELLRFGVGDWSALGALDTVDSDRAA